MGRRDGTTLGTSLGDMLKIAEGCELTLGMPLGTSMEKLLPLGIPVGRNNVGELKGWFSVGPSEGISVSARRALHDNVS